MIVGLSALAGQEEKTGGFMRNRLTDRA